MSIGQEKGASVGPVVRDQNGQPTTWAGFCRAVRATVEAHEARMATEQALNAADSENE